MKTYLRIIAYARPLRSYIVPYFIFSVMASVFGLMTFAIIKPLLDVLFKQKDNTQQVLDTLNKTQANPGTAYIKELFNHFFEQIVHQFGAMGALQIICVALVLAAIIKNLFGYAATRVIERFKAHVIATLRQAVFEKTIHLPMQFFTNERKGNLISNLTTDIQEVEGSIGRAFSAIFKELFTLILSFILLFNISANLTFFTLLVIPITGALIGVASRRLREDAHHVQERVGNLTSILDEAIGGIRIVKGFNAERSIIQRFSNENFGYKRDILRLYNRMELTAPLSEVVGIATVSGILLYGGSLVLGGNSPLSASSFLLYVIFFSQVLPPAKAISGAVSSLQRGMAAGERILKLLDTPNNITEKPDAIILKGFQEKISVKNIDFEYEEGISVLKNINFDLQKGKTIALVGSSGGGKSTIADLFPRFYDTTKGQILIDGQDLRDVTIFSLRQLMGIVTQESILFNDTIFNNIAFGIAATPEAVETAARIANAHDFITETPMGYQTIIGDRGTKLSGGQRQRLSIARAILKNPPILILDEATSALDTESEKLVQEALTYLMKNRTTLVIAHRLSTIQNADEILVIHQGEMIERGTHDQLLEIEDGFYKKLSTMQSFWGVCK